MKPAVREKGAAIALAFLAMAAFAASVLLAGCGGGPSPVTSDSPAPGRDNTSQPPAPLSPITGKPVVKPGSPVAVSVDNYPKARPESGLAQADVVYEALAEGGITRYLAVFYSQAPAVVGPVRSARPYFALLAKEWGAVFAHCGGDPKDVQPIRDWNVVDADEFKHGELYWRDNAREAPHNLYTSVDNLRKTTSEPLPAPGKRYEFQDWSDKPVAGLEVRYARDYAVQYKYAEKRYERWILDGNQGPWQYRDRDTNEKPDVANVIVQFAKSRVAYSDGGLIIDLVDEGRSAYLLGGRYSEGTWKKESLDKPTFFYTAEGKKIALAAGQTWVQIVPEDATVSVLETK
jgi:hypothetical protein